MDQIHWYLFSYGEKVILKHPQISPLICDSHTLKKSSYGPRLYFLGKRIDFDFRIMDTDNDSFSIARIMNTGSQ